VDFFYYRGSDLVDFIHVFGFVDIFHRFG